MLFRYFWYPYYDQTFSNLLLTVYETYIMRLGFSFLAAYKKPIGTNDTIVSPSGNHPARAARCSARLVTLSPSFSGLAQRRTCAAQASSATFFSALKSCC